MRQTMTSNAVTFGRFAAAACSVIGLFATEFFATEARAQDCAAYGPEFTSVEGSGACMKISGHVRVEITGRPVGRIPDQGFGPPGNGAAPAAMRTQEPVGSDAGDFPTAHHLRLHQDSDPTYSGWYVR